MVASGFLVAHQVAGKAVRDGLFLSRFPPSDLPRVVAAAALVAVLLGLGFARLMALFGPMRLAPGALGVGSILHLYEFAVLEVAGDTVRAIVITVVYLHLVGFGAILLSGFWSVVNEFYDPREAKVRFGRITGAGTAGGIAGGLLAERGAAWFGVESLLVLLAGLHLVTAIALWRIHPDRRVTAVQPKSEPVWSAARDAFQQAPFLVNLAVLVLFGTMSAALLDYLFKSGAAAQLGKGPALTQYFALFYAANQVVSIAVQSMLTPVVLRRLGLGRTVQFHPAAVAVGAAATLLGPRVVMAPLARGLELVLRASFLRSGYELFFTPVPPREKRAVKTFIDVACDRMGDALGAGILQLLLVLGPERAVTPILLTTIALAVLSLRITSRMDAAYVKVLEHGLLSRAVAVNEADVQDSTTLSALMRTGRVSPRTGLARPVAPPVEAPDSPSVTDSALSRLADLRSGDTQRVAAALRPELPFEPSLAPQTIRLLAWNES